MLKISFLIIQPDSEKEKTYVKLQFIVTNKEIKLEEDINYNLQLDWLLRSFQNEIYTLLHLSRYIGEGGKLVSDNLDISGKSNIDGYLVNADTEITFDSLDRRFLLESLKNVPLVIISLTGLKYY